MYKRIKTRTPWYNRYSWRALFVVIAVHVAIAFVVGLIHGALN